MKKEVTLTNGLRFEIQEFNNLNLKNDRCRLFVPIWNQFFHNEEFRSSFRKSFSDPKDPSIGDQSDLWIDYYQYNVLSHKKKPDFNRAGKTERKYNPYYLLLSEEFNPELNARFSSHKAKQKYINSLSESQKDEMVYKILEKLFKEFSYTVWNEKTQELLEDAIYEEKVEFPFLDEEEFEIFLQEEMKKISVVRDYLNKKPHPSVITEKDNKFIKETFSGFAFIEILIKDYRIINIRNEIRQFLINYYSTKILFTRTAKLNSEFRGEMIEVMASNAEQILDKFLVILKDRYKKSPSANFKKNYKDLIKTIESIKKSEAHTKIGAMLRIHSMFVDYRSAKQYLLLKIEPIVESYIRFISKEGYKALIKEYELTKEENRLYIVHNIGIRRLKYKNPLLNEVFIKYIDFSSGIRKLFFETVLIKRNEISQRDLELLISFKVFLKFYRVYKVIARNEDRYVKNESRHLSRREDLKEFYDEAEITDIKSIKNKKNEEELNEENEEELNEEIEENEECEIEPSNELNDEQELQIKIRKSRDPIKYKDKLSLPLQRYVLEDYLMTSFQERDVKVLMMVSEEYTQEAIAEKLKISRKTVIKITEKAAEKLEPIYKEYFQKNK